MAIQASVIINITQSPCLMGVDVATMTNFKWDSRQLEIPTFQTSNLHSHLLFNSLAL